MTELGIDGVAERRFDFVTGMRESQRLRLATLVRLRWLSVAGQTAACIGVAWVLWWPFPVAHCFALIGLSVGLNIFLAARYSGSYRLSSSAALTAASSPCTPPRPPSGRLPTASPRRTRIAARTVRLRGGGTRR